MDAFSIADRNRATSMDSTILLQKMKQKLTSFGLWQSKALFNESCHIFALRSVMCGNFCEFILVNLQ